MCLPPTVLHALAQTCKPRQVQAMRQEILQLTLVPPGVHYSQETRTLTACTIWRSDLFFFFFWAPQWNRCLDPITQWGCDMSEWVKWRKHFRVRSICFRVPVVSLSSADCLPANYLCNEARAFPTGTTRRTGDPYSILAGRKQCTVSRCP